jgi:RNA polymerase sigma-70 factor (ECF subfamily)
MRPTTVPRGPVRGDTDVDRDEFLVRAQVYRRELVAHCYRMTGSLHEAEDLVQETYLRAWRGWNSFQGRSSVRTWLHTIATNLCLTAVRHSRTRVLPGGLGEGEGGTVLWIDPFPTERADPAEVVAARSSLRLALIAGLQHLPARQRAVFILREALGYPAGEIATMLDMSVVAVKSALQRARAKLDEVGPRPDQLAEPDEPADRAALDRYMTAFEQADVAAMTELLRADAVLSVVPDGIHLTGKRTCVAHLAQGVLAEPGRFRMAATSANGQPAAITYVRAGDTWRPFGLVVLTVAGDQVTAIRAFLGAEVVAAFGFAGSGRRSANRPQLAGSCTQDQVRQGEEKE